MTEDFYDLLDVPSDAPQEEIKDAYREQVRVYHPDHNDDDRARAQFTAVKKAYDILGDPVERQAYDRLGHEDYVAKRTSGLPSADVWRTTNDSSDGKSINTTDSDATTTDDSGSEFTYDDSTTASSDAESTTSKTASAEATAGAASAGTTAGGATSTGVSSTSATGSTTGASGTGASSTDSTRSTGTGTTDGGTVHGTGRSGRQSRSRSGTGNGRFDDNAIVRWWRRQNFSLPLIWLSVLIYLGGLVHVALENAAGLESLGDELAAVGTDAGAVLDVLSSDRYGIDASLEYLAAFELVAPPLEAELWYATLAGGVGLTLLALFGVRAYRDEETWGPVSIDETIVIALAITATTVLVGGPLLAGAVLMPVLFAVIVRHTRRGPGWKPSYLYVLPVLAPLAGFAITAAGESTLAIDLLAFVVLPLVGGLGLPLRATIRKRFGR